MGNNAVKSHLMWCDVVSPETYCPALAAVSSLPFISKSRCMFTCGPGFGGGPASLFSAQVFLCWRE